MNDSDTSEPKAKVLPVYFVADESGSMKDLVGELNRGLTTLLDTMQTETMAAAKIRFSVIGFSDDVTVHLAPSDFRELSRMPTLTHKGGTSYKAVFEMLRNQIPSDVVTLKHEGNLVHRPAIFFLSDGYPNNNEDWRTALSKLKDTEFREHPNVIAFGLGSADPRVILEVASKEQFAFQAAVGTDTGKAIIAFCESLIQSIVNSADAIARGNAELQVKRPEGFKLAVDLV